MRMAFTLRGIIFLQWRYLCRKFIYAKKRWLYMLLFPFNEFSNGPTIDGAPCITIPRESVQIEVRMMYSLSSFRGEVKELPKWNDGPTMEEPTGLMLAELLT